MTMHLLSDLKANHDRFVSRAVACGLVWGLQSSDGWAICQSIEYECQVMPFWSDKAYAARHAVNEWAEHTATPIELDVFIDRWLRGMHEDGVLVGVNFNSDLAGLEVEPIDLARRLAPEA